MISLLAACLISHSAIAAFEYRDNSPSHLFPHYVAAIDESAQGDISSPSYLPWLKSSFLHYSGTSPYSRKELSSHTVRIGTNFPRGGVAATWNYFGLKEYQEHRASLAAGVLPCRYFSAGIEFTIYHLRIDTPEVSIGRPLFNFSASAVFSPLKWVRVSFAYENIASLIISSARDILYPTWAGGLTIKPIDGLSIIWNITQTPTGPIHSFSATVNPLKYLTLATGYSKETSTFTASIAIIYRHVSVSYGLRFNPHLGLTHCAGFTATLRDVYPIPLSYGRLIENDHVPGRKKIDINKCTEDEIREIPGLDRLYADRIISYRKTIGPISRASLEEIGMARKAATELIRRTSGYSGKKSGPEPRNHADNGKLKKRLFRKLLDLGLSPHTAMVLADMAEKKQMNDIREKIAEMPHLTSSARRKVFDLCEKSF